MQQVLGHVGLDAARPARGEYIGQSYLAIDSDKEYKWNGAAWFEMKTFGTIRVPAGSCHPTGTATIVTNNGWTCVNLPATGTSGIAWAQSFHPQWETATLSWGFSPVTGNAGNIRWSVNVKRANALGFSTLLSDAPFVTDTFTAAGGTVSLQMEHVFTHPSSFACHSPTAVLGEVIHISVDRLGDDGADTHTSQLLLTNISLNQLT
jgi:hypothetical protein